MNITSIIGHALLSIWTFAKIFLLLISDIYVVCNRILNKFLKSVNEMKRCIFIHCTIMKYFVTFLSAIIVLPCNKMRICYGILSLTELCGSINPAVSCDITDQKALHYLGF